MPEQRWEDQDHGTDDADELRRLFRERLHAGPPPTPATTDAAALAAEVEEIAGDGGWSRDDGRKAYQALAEELVAAGLSPDKAIDVLCRAYDAAAAEFGN